MKRQNCYRDLKITTNSNTMVEQFCKSILQIVTHNSKALVNLVMGLASQNYSKSVVQVSLNPCYHYQYSSINKTVDGLDKKVGKEKSKEEHQKGEPVKLSRVEVEKKFAYEGGSFFKAL